MVKDLIAARVKSGGALLFEADAQSIEGLDTNKPTIHFTHQGKNETLECDFIAGCDGFHGISRPAIPEGALTTYDRIYPFGWLGILSESPPLVEMTYANHERGFALASRRSPQIARLYVQCTPDEDHRPVARCAHLGRTAPAARRRSENPNSARAASSRRA